MPSADVARNAHVRQALTAALPGARVTVRNGPNRTVPLTWSDGPTPNQVLAAAPDRFRAADAPGTPRAVRCPSSCR